MNNKILILLNLIIMSMFFSGCGSRTTLNQNNFLFDVSRDMPQQKISKDIVLDVKQFSIDRAFSTKNFVYRKNKSEYETDFYNQFLINPDDMITEKTRSWLSQSGLFKWILEPGSYIDATHVLEGNITELYGDFSDESLPKAKMDIRFFLIKLSDKSIAFGKTYESESEIKSRAAESLIEAYDKCLTNILTNLEQDLEEQL
jgi:cholesterol transport system auxiliary component